MNFKNTYVNIEIGKAQMPSVISDYFDSYIKGKNISKKTEEFLKEACKLNCNIFDHALIGMYKGNYVIAFLNMESIETCACMITHNKNERDLFERFYKLAKDNILLMKGLYYMVYKIVLGRFIIRGFDELDSYGIIYDFFPNKSKVIDEFISYIDKKSACRIANATAISAVTNCLERNVTIKEIFDIIPNDVESKFLNREWDDFELSQFEALMPGIKYAV